MKGKPIGIDKMNEGLKKRRERRPISSLTRRQKQAGLEKQLQHAVKTRGKLVREIEILGQNRTKAQNAYEKVKRDLNLFKDFFAYTMRIEKHLHKGLDVTGKCFCPCHFLHIDSPDGVRDGVPRVEADKGRKACDLDEN